MSTARPVLSKRQLGEELRELRNRRSMTGTEVARRLEWSHSSKVYRIEGGKIAIGDKDLTDLLDLYGVDDTQHRADLLAAANAPVSTWRVPYGTKINRKYSEYLRHEGRAAELGVFEALIVHGLCQTEDYARAVIRSSAPHLTRAAVEERVKLRMWRKRQLERTDRPPLRVTAVFAESVLRWHIGGSAVLRGQLEHLLHLARLTNISIRIIPFTAGVFPGMLSSFTVMTFPNPGSDPVVYAESLTGDVFPPLAETGRYIVALQVLQGVALDAVESIALIESILAELTPH